MSGAEFAENGAERVEKSGKRRGAVSGSWKKTSGARSWSSRSGKGTVSGAESAAEVCCPPFRAHFAVFNNSSVINNLLH